MDRRWPRALLAAAMSGLSGCASMSDRHQWPNQPSAHSPGVHATGLTANRAALAFVPETAALEAFPFPQESAEPRTVDDYRRRALVENRTVQAARAKVDSLGAAIAASPSSPHAQCQFHQALQELALAEMNAAVGVKRACADLALGQRLIEILEDQRLAASQTRDAVRKRSQTAGDADVLRSEVVIARLDQKRIEADRIREQGRAALGELIHAAPGAPLAVLSRDPILEAGGIGDQSDLILQSALQDNPSLQVRAAAALSDRARLDQTFLQSQSQSQSHFHRKSQGVPDAEVQQVRGDAWKSALDYEAARDHVLQTVGKLTRQAQSLSAELDLIRRTDQPKSRQAFGIALSDYGKSKASLDSLLGALDDRLESNLNAARLEHELTQTLAALEQELGHPLPAHPPDAPPAQATAAPATPAPPNAPTASASGAKRDEKPKPKLEPKTSAPPRESAAKPPSNPNAKPNSRPKPPAPSEGSSRSSLKPKAPAPSLPIPAPSPSRRTAPSAASPKASVDPEAKAKPKAIEDELPMDGPTLPPLSPAKPDAKAKTKPAGPSKPRPPAPDTGRYRDEERDFSALSPSPSPLSDRFVIAAGAVFAPDPDEAEDLGNDAVPFPS